MKKGDFLFIFVILFILGGALYFIPLQKKIDITLSGIESKIGDSEYLESKTIHIKGKYTNYLFKEDSFVGNIKIDGYDISEGLVNTTIRDGFTPLVYANVTDKASIERFGYLCITNGFKEVVIFNYEPNNHVKQSLDEESGMFIIAPANNREKALSLAEKLSKRSNFTKDILWD